MDSDPQPHPSAGLPGCGLAVYVVVLGALGLVGMIGVFASTYALLQTSTAPVSPLMPGSQVPVWRLKPMRDAGILGIDEAPPAWHDESPRGDGTRVCALMPKELVRLHDGEVSQLAYAEITEVTEASNVVTAVGGQGAVKCQFRSEEGAPRFARQLKAEAGLN